MNINLIKDIFYLIGSSLGTITFIMSFSKRDKSIFTYRTEMGNEIYPMLVCIRGNMYNVKLLNNDVSCYVHKLPSTFKFSSVKRNEHNLKEYDESSFFPVLKEGEVLLINNEMSNLSMKIEYEDQFRNKYFQSFKIQKDQIGSPERFKKNKSQSLYKLFRRKKRFLWVWY